MSDKIIEFGPFRLENEIVYDSRNRQLELPHQTIRVLEVFLEQTLRHGQTVLSSAELRSKAWPGRVVDKNNLHQQIIRLRKELGADAIASTSGPRGYQFTLPVRVASQPAAVHWRSISVLPFVCPPGHFRDEERLRLAGYHLALGVMHQLRNLTTLELREIAPEYLQPGWQPNTAQIARAQRTSLVLTGHLTAGHEADELRAQLIEAETASVLWTGRFNVNTADSAAVEQEIGRQLAERLGFDPASALVRRATKAPRPEAVASYRKGRYIWYTGYAILKEAFDEFTYAASLDPDYAEPWVGLADIWLLRSLYSFAEFPPNEGMPKALAAARRALEIDPCCGSAHATRGYIALLWEWNWELAEAHFKQAIRHDPGYMPVWIYYARLLAVRGRVAESIAHARRGEELGPHMIYTTTLVAWNYYFVEQHEQALKLCRQATAAVPHFPVAWAIQAMTLEALERFAEAAESAQVAISLGENMISLATLGLIHGKMGRRAEAEQVLQELSERRARGYLSAYYPALVQLGLDNRQEALRLLAEALEERSEWIAHLPIDHRLRTLRAEAGYQAILRQVGLA